MRTYKNVPGNKTAMLAKMFHPKAIRNSGTRLKIKARK